MGAPQEIENKVRSSFLSLIGILGNTTPASTAAKLISAKKYASETTDRPPGTFDNPTKVNAFGPLVNNGFYVVATAGGAKQKFIFALTDFSNINGPTLTEIIAALNARLTSVTAAQESGGRLSVAAAAGTTSFIGLSPLTGDSRYGDALGILGFIESACDIGNFKMTAQLPLDIRNPVMPVVQVATFVPSTNVVGPVVTTPIVSFAEETGILSITSGAASVQTVQAAVVG